MELAVRLSRQGEEPWGFRLIGGVDFAMPLTVVKVLPGSPAERAGLRNGDTVVRIGDADAGSMSHQDSRAALAEAQDCLELSVVRGLYDPVLDDTEFLYETDQPDFDQPSVPTEVDYLELKLPEFTESLPLPDLLDNQLSNLLDPEKSVDRSLTASPFVPQTKPYRPFSTEPVTEIPPLEEPIILNPDYHDDFGKLVDLEDELLPATRFKLPISEQYDPDGTKQKKTQKETVELATDEKTVTMTAKENIRKEIESKETIVEKSMKETTEMKEVMTKEEVRFLDEMKKELDLEKIELTATSVVDESIEKAMTVAAEIKQEIDVELKESSVESKSVTDSKIESEITKESATVQSKESKQEVEQLVKLIDETTEEIIKQNGHKHKEVKITEEASIDMQRKSVKESEVIQDIQDTTEKVERKSSVLKEDKQESRVKIEQRDVKRETIEDENTFKSQTKYITDETRTDTKYSTSKLLAEQRAYTIGLQTIPNIRGTVHSSYHYDLLLKTFFIHLTDVMVALSRFILAEPVLSKEPERQEEVAVVQKEIKKDVTKGFQETGSVEKKESVATAVVTADKKDSDIKKEKKALVRTAIVKEAKRIDQEEKIKEQQTKEKKAEQKTEEERLEQQKIEEQRKIEQEIIEKELREVKQEAITKIDEQKLIQGLKVESEYNYEDENLEISELMEKKLWSGSEMAQRTDKKSTELMQKMGAVITEFETKAGVEEVESTRERRSRSRSRIDATPDISRLDKTSQEITETTTASSEYSSSILESSKKTRSETKYETSDYESKEGKNIYVAIVEAHVYTNKDAIFDEQLEISETTAIKGIEESVVTKQATEAVSAEKISVKKEEKKATQAILDTTAKKRVQLVEKTFEKPKPIVQEVIKPKPVVKQVIKPKLVVNAIKKDIKTTEKKEEVVIQEVVEPVVTIEEIKTEALAVVEETKAEAIKTEVIDVPSIRKEPIVIKETVKEAVSLTQAESAIEKVVEKKESTISEKLATESISIKEESTALKESIVLDEQSLSIKETSASEQYSAKKEAIAVKEEIVAIKEESASVAEKSVSIAEQHVAKEQTVAVKEEVVALKEESMKESIVVSEAVIEKETLKESAAIVTKDKTKEVTVKKARKTDEESAALKIQKNEVKELEKTFVGIEKEENVSIKKVEISEVNDNVEQESSFVAKSVEQESSFVAKTVESEKVKQESTFVAKSVESQKVEQESTFVAKSLETKESKLTLQTDLTQQKVETNNIETPSPPYVPPTPLTDEYVFKLEIPLPKREGLPEIPRDCTPSDSDEEDPHIVKKGLVPHIEAEVADVVKFDPPLATPPASPGSPPQSPRKLVYTKPGLRGGGDRDYTKEEILEIERKSSLLASAIDETIKSIEEYKEEVGIKQETTSNSTENGVMYNGYAKVVETKIFDTAVQENKTMEEIKELANNIEISESKIETTKSEHTQSMSVEKSDIGSQVNGTKTSKVDETEDSAETKPIITEVEDIETPATTVSEQTPVQEERVTIVEEKIVEEVTRDPMEGYKPVHFDPEELLNAQRERRALGVQVPHLTASQERELYKTPSGELIGTHKGIVDGLEESTVDAEVAKELGKPGITEEKIAELISGESEMLREAHVMGLSRVLASHMHRPDDDSSVDFKRIKPIVESLKDSEVLKALNEEMLKAHEEKKKNEEKKWTTFLQKPKRPVPRAKFGYYGNQEPEEEKAEPYKVKIVKQPKPKVAPDYKPKDFNTGLLPWEERALKEPSPPPVGAEDPILIPEEAPELLEAVDPLPESEVPDLEDSGIELPPPQPKEETPPPEEQETKEGEELDLEAVVEETEKIIEENLAEEMERTNLAEQLLMNVQNMVDPNATLDQQLAQMRAQLAALAQLPGVIQQSLEMVNRQLSQLSQLEATQTSQITEEIPPSEPTAEAVHETEVTQNGVTIEEQPNEEPIVEEPAQEVKPTITPEEIERMKREEEAMLEEQRKMEKQKKEAMEKARIEHESRQVKQRPTPRVGKPKPVFGPATPQERPLVLPGGRKWRKPQDAYNEQIFAETLAAQAEIISGKAKGMAYESVHLPYDERINFMKYEKPPVSLDHLKDSDVYKMIHNMESQPLRRVDMLTPVIAEADYREKCRSMTPCSERLAQQVQP